MGDTHVAVETEKHGRRYQDDTRELAFQLWELRCQRNAAKVSRLLATEEYGNLDISARTVQRWAEDDGWELEAASRFEDAFPVILHTLYRGLAYTAMEGAEYWQDVAAGRAEPNKVRMQAITAAYDRIGFSPIGKGTAKPGAPNPEDDSPSDAGELGQLSPDRLAAIEARYRAKRRA